MTNTSPTASSSSNSEPTISNNNGGSDNPHLPHMPITGHKLNGHNYLQWSQSVSMFICGKGRDDYITGVANCPAKEDPTYKQWKSENSMVMSWLINSMINDIGENFLLYETAKEIWDAAKQTYSNSDNTAELFGIESTLHDLRQGELTVTQFFNMLTRNWQQLDMFEKHKWGCSTDGVLYKEIVEQKRVFKFLLGLNHNLDEVRGRILGTKPLLSIREVFSEVRREESRKKVMMGPMVKAENSPIGAAIDGSALAVRGTQNNFNDGRPRRGRPWCDHCRRPGHTKETCWKIHGKSADWKPTRPTYDRESRGNMVLGNEGASSVESSPFNREQMELLQKLFTQSSSQVVIGTGSLAQKGNFLKALNVKREQYNPWIIDSGASDHMTGDAKIFKTYSTCHGNLSVRIADGSLSKVAGTGSIEISKDLTL
ncbi:hypothetical protein LWI28_026726 [Acer negundo]|uniref:Retrovirus-related Pol polyprotein from transposon TNT 1-94-like beta-barrel domain-containing protein n=1 Tax=Acer negundo TaxID=4023 RepID=A0AAD5IGD5_ACENE|nr:hypothetical protein LWI28_026726 [Acer negundo]